MSKRRGATPYHLERSDGTIDVKRTTERITLAADFKHLIPSGVTVSSGSVTATVQKGTDATPANLLDGLAAVSGTQVLQAYDAGVDGVLYCLEWSAVLSNGDTLRRVTLLLVSDKC